MTEAIASLTDLSPIGAVLVIAALAQVGITQIAKQQSWTKARTQAVAAGVAGILGLLAAVVLGLITGVPDSIVKIVSAILLSIAAVAVLGKALYSVLGYVIPDGTTPDDQGGVNVIVNSTANPEVVTSAIAAHWRRADRDGVMDGRDTPAVDVRATHASVDDEPA